jgi:elongation factor G
MKLPVTGIKVSIHDGAYHPVDSSDIAFQAAARGAFLEGYVKANPIILEPIMKVVVETPVEFQGSVMASLNQRRAMIVGSQDEGQISVIEAQAPLAEMFGYTTILRSMTQGKAQYSMEFATYRQVPRQIAEELIKNAAESRKK